MIFSRSIHVASNSISFFWWLSNIFMVDIYIYMLYICYVRIFCMLYTYISGFPSGGSGKECTCQCRRCKKEMQFPYLGWGDPLEKGKATYSSILAWRIPWTEEPGELQSMGLQRNRQNWSNLAHMHIYILYILNI